MLQLEHHLRPQAMLLAWRGSRAKPLPSTRPQQAVQSAEDRPLQQVPPTARGQRAAERQQQEIQTQPPPGKEQRRRSTRQAGKHLPAGQLLGSSPGICCRPGLGPVFSGRLGA